MPDKGGQELVLDWSVGTLLRFGNLYQSNNYRIAEQLVQHAVRLRARLASVRHLVMVMSGESGVSKSAMTMQSKRVGVVQVALLILTFSLLFFAAACSTTLASPSPEPKTLQPTLPSPPAVLESPTLTLTATDTPPATPSLTPIVTGTPPTAAPPATLTRRAIATLQPVPSPTRPLDCPVPPTGSFRTIWQSEPGLQSLLGCPTSHHPRIASAAWLVKTSYQAFERGRMIWSDHIGWFPKSVIYVLYTDSTYQRFDDTFDSGVDPVSGGTAPPPGLVEPLYGFGKLWRSEPSVRTALGWAVAGELAGTGRFQMFDGGDMIWISQTEQTFVFVFRSGQNLVRVFNIPFAEK